MLSIIIADDEAGIIDLCKVLIEYPNASVIGEAHNGLELLDKIAALRPNTVITDICMPGMTGLELIEKAKQAYPEVSFIVMSGYTDFQYAQTALRFGVWDYLLKPLKKTEVNRTLEKLDKHLEQKQAQDMHSACMEESLQEGMETLAQKYVRDVWDNGMAAPVPLIGGTPVLRFAGAVQQCVLLGVDSNFAAAASDASALAQQAGSTLEKIGRLATASCRQTCLLTKWPYALALLLYDEQDAAQTSQTLLKAISGELRAMNSAGNLIHMAAASGALLPGDAAHLPEAIRQAKIALKWRLEKRQSGVIAYDAETERALVRRAGFTASKEEVRLREAVEKLDAEAACAVITSVWQGYAADRAVLGSRYRLLEEMLHCLNETLRRLSWVDTMPALTYAEVFDILSGGYGAEQITQQLTGYVRRTLEQCRSFVQNRENSMVRQAKEYVAQHFAENISLNQVAKCVCLSPSYFSTLFKSETGGGFVEYLQHVRVEQAKKLLKETKMRVGDIAQAVGYHDLKFFNKIFLKETTVTPSEYRKFYA